MDTSKLLIKTLSLALANAMIVMTLILSPIPFSRSSEVQAADSAAVEPSCEDREKDPGQVYKAGCKFNEDMAKSGMKEHYPEGVVGMVEQLLGAVFAVIGIKAVWVPVPKEVASCPINVGASVAFPIVAAGSLAYLLGEIAANSEFKKGSKIAVDKSFQARKDETYLRVGSKEDQEKSREESKKNEVSNDKQVAAFEALETIYGHQVTGLKKKIQLATAAEIAFLTAEGFEIENNLHIDAVGLSQATLFRTESQTLLTAIGSSSAGLIGTGIIPTPLPACWAFGLAGVDYFLRVEAMDLAKAVKGSSEMTVKVTSAESDIIAIKGILGASLLAVPPASPKAVEELATSVANAGANDALVISERTIREELLVPLSTTAAACLSPVDLDPAKKALAITLESSVIALESLRLKPIFCAGIETSIFPTGDYPLSLIPSNGSSVDNNTSASTYTDGSSAYNLFKKEKLKNRFYVRTIINNLFHRIAHEKIQNENFSNPTSVLNRIAATTSHANYMTEEAMKLYDRSDLALEIKKIENKYKGNIDRDILLKDFIAEIKNSIISSASAGVEFKDLLMMAVKIVVLIILLGGWVTNYAFPKEVTRMVTWGTMAVVNGAIISFDSKAKKEASKRLDIVKKEKEIFIESHAIKQGIDLTSIKGGKLKITSASSNLTGGSDDAKTPRCAVPNGKSFAPAICKKGLAKIKPNIPIGQAKFLASGDVLKSTPSLLSSVVQSAAQGDQFSNPSLFSAQLGALEGNKQALIKRVSDLRKKIDAAPKVKDKNGKTIARTSLSQLNTNFKKLFTGDPSKTGISSDQAANFASVKLPDLEKLKKLEKDNGAKTAGFSVPKFSIPAPSNNGFDFGSEGSGNVVVEDDKKPSDSAEQNLEQFVVNTEEINENENVDIFKLISNRYLVSYPRLLEEK